MAIKIPKDHIINQPFQFQGPPKFTQIEIGIFGLKIYHLATLRSISLCNILVQWDLRKTGFCCFFRENFDRNFFITSLSF
jgi:hypothetical protein